jgi:hypothetical protein
MRYCTALLAVATLAGCTGPWSSVGPATHERATHRGVRSCLREWNGTANAAVRRDTVPPFGPYPLFGQGPALTPKGGYQAFVGLSISIGALVSYPEIDRAAGVYGSPTITTGRNTDVGGRIYVPDRAGRLRPTDRFRPT